eukprot:GILJ01005326.1.p1 GENE.GILJ01005326.1~~GILJ01005326.1.p1  ORF type:complete len:113 (+),score=13.50 GILJ01005326.1:115-453(+)
MNRTGFCLVVLVAFISVFTALGAQSVLSGPHLLPLEYGRSYSGSLLSFEHLVRFNFSDSLLSSSSVQAPAMKPLHTDSGEYESARFWVVSFIGLQVCLFLAFLIKASASLAH